MVFSKLETVGDIYHIQFGYSTIAGTIKKLLAMKAVLSLKAQISLHICIVSLKQDASNDYPQHVFTEK